MVLVSSNDTQITVIKDRIERIKNQRKTISEYCLEYSLYKIIAGGIDVYAVGVVNGNDSAFRIVPGNEISADRCFSLLRDYDVFPCTVNDVLDDYFSVFGTV